jgi:threonine/homoserine/homoserine lactone efflux protein
MLGLGIVLMSSAVLFTLVKLLGALYLFYIGTRHLLGRASALAVAPGSSEGTTVPGPLHLFREAFFLSATNPKPILFFTALFPQFVAAQAPLLPQFFTLTGIFMAMSFCTLMGYAMLASRARSVLFRPRVLKWFNRVVGAVFVSFGAALLSMKRSAT